MKTIFFVCRLMAAIALLFFCSISFAQGCDQGIVTELVPCYKDKYGNVTDTEDQTCQAGAAGASPCVHCYQGSGYCPDTGIDYSTANLAPDYRCGSGCGGGGCCDGTIMCNVPRQKCDTSSCLCVSSGSPILVDTTGMGFRMTSVEEGVTFDIFADHRPVKMAWTAADSGNAFLALDRDGNGHIDSGKELFGNVTAQPSSDEPNGYLALAEFDKPENGGNGDGIIDWRDAVYSKLRLWIDANHDGISQPEELYTLPELGVFSLGLRYRDDRHLFDQYGNWFRYQGAVNPNPRDGESKDGRVTYDVFFEVVQNPVPISDPQSRAPQRQRRNEWELALADRLLLASLRARGTGCRPATQQNGPGGTR